MPSAFRNQKNLNEWLELDYYQRPRGLRRWCNRLTFLLLVFCLAGVVGTYFLLPRPARLVQAGPVTSAHSIVHDCERCHQEAFSTAKKLLPSNATVRVVPDDACIQCHDGPPHALARRDRNKQDQPPPESLQSEEVRCATCHREHRGRPALARVPDEDCTGCHADLKGHRKGGAEGLVFNNVNAFTDDHPEFGLLRNDKLARDRFQDPQRIWNPETRKFVDKPPIIEWDAERNRFVDRAKVLFNHHFHLVKLEKLSFPGLDKLPAERRQVFTDARTRLKEKSCIYCHEPDAAGRYMQPINYEKHCADCHTLSVQLIGTFKAAQPEDQERLDTAVQRFNAQPAPHKQPSVIRAVMRERLLEFLQTNRVAAVSPDETGGLVDLGVFGKRPSPEQWKRVNESLGPLERVLFGSEQLEAVERSVIRHDCTHCHIPEKKALRGKKEKDDDGLDGLPVFAETRIPSRWLTQARFSHQHHRMLLCTECHAAPESKKTSDILMPSVTSCQKCHNPKVGVRNDCVECHNYHNRQHTREVHKDWTIDRALSK
jgi:predicted CXXCH cytochrome family protein